MLTIDEAFRKFKSRLELNDREQSNASSRHTEVREWGADLLRERGEMLAREEQPRDVWL